MRTTRIAVAGLCLVVIGCQSHDKEENEVKMRLDEVPPAVRETLTREAGGAPIDQVEREEEHGRTVYEADVKSGGKTWEITVDANGNLISRKEDKDEKEDDD